MSFARLLAAFAMLFLVATTLLSTLIFVLLLLLARLATLFVPALLVLTILAHVNSPRLGRAKKTRDTSSKIEAHADGLSVFLGSPTPDASVVLFRSDTFEKPFSSKRALA